MPLHVAVTGAGGFVGGFVARWLAAHGHTVTAIARQPAPADLEPSPDITWRQADLLGPQPLPESLDALIHCAAVIPERCADPQQLYHLNIEMSRNVFDKACRAGARAIVFLSSMSAYGAIAVPTITETTLAGEVDPYGRAKRDSEALLETAGRQGLHSALSIRLPGTVGKGSHHNFLSVALARVRAGEVVKARNPDSLFNNIVYVGDLAAFLDAWITAPRFGYAVTNLAARDPLRFREVLGLLFSLSGREERLVFERGGKPSFLISLDRAISMGYRPSTVRASVECFVRDVAQAKPPQR
jgi:nucleoside-diphosphate-sugar epimerase